MGLFFHGLSFALFLTKKLVGLHFGRFFSQTNPVTLMGLWREFQRRQKRTLLFCLENILG
jgi:hypothetical protein